MIHLNAHGRYSEPTNAPIATGPMPWRRIWVAIAVAVKPSGMPSVMYSMKNVVRRPAFVARRSGKRIRRAARRIAGGFQRASISSCFGQ